MKIYGANIRCSVCGAEPWPSDPAVRETFDLRRVDDGWFCELHRPPKEKRASRPVAATPLEALAEFERLLEAEGAHLEAAIVHDSDDLLPEFKAYSSEVARAFAEVRKALTPQRPPATDDTPKSRAPKKIKAKERLGDGQQDWVTGDAQPAGVGSP